jgi:hypothetical protein
MFDSIAAVRWGGADASADVFMAVTIEITVFWNVTPCSLVDTKGVAEVGNVELNVILSQSLQVLD